MNYLGDFHDSRNDAKAGKMVGVATGQRSSSFIDQCLGSADPEKKLETSDEVLNVSDSSIANPTVNAEASHRRQRLVTRELRVDKDLSLVASQCDRKTFRNL